MNAKKILPFGLATLLALGAAGGIAYAADHKQDQRDIAALANMKVTLTQAITTAELQVGGKAVGADVSQEKGVTQIAVEVVGQQGVKTVLVDAQSGKVTATRDAGQDREDND